MMCFPLPARCGGPAGFLPVLLVLLVGFLLGACRGGEGATGSRDAATRPLKAPDKVDSMLDLRHARGFAVAWREGLAHVYVGNGAAMEAQAADGAKAVDRDSIEAVLLQSDQSFHYILLPKTASNAEEKLHATWPDAQILHTPVQRAALVSTTHSALFSALGAQDAVAGLAWSGNAFDPVLRARAKTGSLANLGLDADIHMEAVLALNPDMVMTYTTTDPAYGAYAKLRALDLPVVVNGEFKEPHPLAQAEWVRLAGLLLDRARMADTLFAGVEQRYRAWQDSAQLWIDRSNIKPRVFTGMDWQGQWTVPQGQSFPARYLADADGAYLWAESPGRGSLFLDVEQVLDKALDAEYWLHPGAARSLAHLEAADPRVRHFEAFQTGQVYNNDARLSPAGGNDYWESAVVRPDRVLRDLVLILHARPKGNGHTEDAREITERLFYYRKLPRR